MAFAHPFYFLRHGETHWNAAGTTQGQFCAGLNETGREQARRAAEALSREPIARIVASPLDRAHETARIVAEPHGLSVETDEALMECHLGERQGTPNGPWLRDYFRGAYDPPGGETFPAFCDRAWAAMERAVARGPNTLIVAHGGLWIAARARVTVEPDLPRMPNALPLHVTPEPGRWRHRTCGELAPASPPDAC
ncbi:MAG TPA: histidine phosphatase family protein [Paracoccaceae bacterium]|nr:histidine phosphatase family protein [Paracoccaceae bacterium]